MNEDLWDKVDDFLSETLGTSDPVLEATLRASTKAGLPAIQVSANQGKLLQLLAQTQGARRILEVGTLGGYSTIWLARALPPEGYLISLELEASYAEVARKNVSRANLGKLVTIRALLLRRSRSCSQKRQRLSTLSLSMRTSRVIQSISSGR